jgi:hypothetical protein
VVGMADWTTIKEELYNNIQILTAKAVAKGKQAFKDKVKQGTEYIKSFTASKNAAA